MDDELYSEFGAMILAAFVRTFCNMTKAKEREEVSNYFRRFVLADYCFC